MDLNRAIKHRAMLLAESARTLRILAANVEQQAIRVQEKLAQGIPSYDIGLSYTSDLLEKADTVVRHIAKTEACIELAYYEKFPEECHFGK